MKRPQHTEGKGDGLKQLWAAVIAQAIEDATRPSMQTLLMNRMEAQRARDWLTKSSRDFDAVCGLAGFEPDRVRSYAKQLIDEAIAKQTKRAA